jgi:excisionase family DNA binding protein
VSALQRLRLCLPDVAQAITEAVQEEITETLEPAVRAELERQAGEFVTTEEAARRTGMSMRAVRRAANSGRLESRKVGRRLLVKLP